jgi:hypothetical protein
MKADLSSVPAFVPFVRPTYYSPCSTVPTPPEKHPVFADMPGIAFEVIHLQQVLKGPDG